MSFVIAADTLTLTLCRPMPPPLLLRRHDNAFVRLMPFYKMLRPQDYFHPLFAERQPPPAADVSAITLRRRPIPLWPPLADITRLMLIFS